MAYLAQREPWGLAEVAAYCGVARPTADRWRDRNRLPEAGEMSGRPWWWPDAIMRWADATGRRPIEGTLWCYRAHTSVWSGSDGWVQAPAREEAMRAVDAWAQSLGIRPAGLRDEHDATIVTVWPADRVVPRLPAGTPVEAWTHHAGDSRWRPAVVTGDADATRDVIYVRIGDTVDQVGWSRLRLPGGPPLAPGGGFFDPPTN